MSDYTLEDRATGFRSSAEAKDFFSSLCVQTSSEDHSASYPMRTMGKARLGRDADHSPHLIPSSRMNRSYIFSLPWCLNGAAGQLLFSSRWGTEAGSCERVSRLSDWFWFFVVVVFVSLLIDHWISDSGGLEWWSEVWWSIDQTEWSIPLMT